MEISYYCFEQIIQLRGMLDSVAMVKMISDAGFDVTTNPIYLNSDYSEIFRICLERVFDEVEEQWIVNDYGYETVKYDISFPELSSFFLFLPSNERDKYLQKITLLLQVDVDDHFYFSDIEMKGKFANRTFHIEIIAGFGFFSPLLKIILQMRKKVLDTVRQQKIQLLENIKRIFIGKVAIQTGANIDFSKEHSWEELLKKLLTQLASTNEHDLFLLVNELGTNVKSREILQDNSEEAA